MDNLQLWGSQTAIKGFKNERDVAAKFNAWQEDVDAQNWLKLMQYNLDDIKSVFATTKVPKKSKTDVQIQVTIHYKEAIDIQNLQVKLVSNGKSGFNQVDRRWVDKCCSDWNMTEEVAAILRHFAGELPPNIDNPKDNRRMFMNEFTSEQQKLVIDWFEQNKAMIVCDILKGRGEFAAEWILVAKIDGNKAEYMLRPINSYIDVMGNGPVTITARGSIKIHEITLQRKGGDGGRPSANQLQFKVDPLLLFEK